MTSSTLARAARLRREISGPRELLLSVRIASWTMALRLLKHVVPLSSLVRMVSRPRPNARRDTNLERKIVVLVRLGARILAWKERDSCLERALVCYRYLSAYGASPQLVVGLGRTPDRVRGHAWVLVDGKVIGDTEEALADYEPLTTFGPDGRRI